MKERKEEIDLLLERNAAEQLENVDWDRLNAVISRRLNQAHRGKTSGIRWPIIIKVAAGIAAAAAVIFIAVSVKTDTLPTVKFENHGNAMVRLVDKKCVATIKIGQTAGKSQVMVDFENSERKIAKCDIKIIDSNGDLKKDSDQPMWIIISKPELTVADNGYSRDEIDLICLL